LRSGISNDTTADSIGSLSVHSARRSHRTVRTVAIRLFYEADDTSHSQGEIPVDAFEGEELVALSERDKQIREEMAAHDAKLNARMGEEMRRKLENDRRNVKGGGTVEEVVERDTSPS
jgi:hypothetical protein